MTYRLKLFFQYCIAFAFRCRELLRGNTILAHKIVGVSRIVLGKKVYISEQVRLVSERGGSIRIGNGSKIGTMSIVEDRGGSIVIGNNSAINSFSVLYGHGGLAIGNNVIAATHLVIVPSEHNFGDPDVPILQQGETKRGVVIEDNVWIGAGVIILDGVTIGEGSVIGAGAVVTKSIPSRSVALGVPARVVRQR
jgi:acetyltransferase-like isoleucine patch superfamily enzyme